VELFLELVLLFLNKVDGGAVTVSSVAISVTGVADSCGWCSSSLIE
jgi:hypothetical protein